MDNSLGGELEARKRALIAKALALPDTKIMRPELEAHAADDLVEDLMFEFLALGDAFTEEGNGQDRIVEADPRYPGPTGESRPRNVEVFIVQVPLVRGSPSWLSHRPAGSFPLLHERTTYEPGRHAVVVRVMDDQRHDLDGSNARRYFETEMTTLSRYVEATNGQLAAWNEGLPALCRDAISNERQRRSEVESRKRKLGPPIVPSDATPVPYSLPRRRRPRVQLDAVETKKLGGRMYLPAQDFADALNEMQRSAQFIAEHPAVHKLDENGMRDIVLLELNGAFPAGGTGETFSKLGKTDIRVVTTLASETGFGDCVFKAECKVWAGPAGHAKP